MAEPKTPKPKTPKPKTPKAKPTPPGQGSMDFNGGGRGGALQRWQPDFVRQGTGKSYGGSNQILADARLQGVGYGGNASNRPPVKYPGGLEVSPGRGGIYDVTSRYNPGRLVNRDVYSTGPVAKSGAAQAVRNSQPGRGALAVVPKPTPTPPRPAPMPETGRATPISSVENSAGSRFNAMGSRDPRAQAPPMSSSGKNNPIRNPGAALARTQPGGALATVQAAESLDDFAKATKATKGLGRRAKGRLLGLATVAAGAAGLGYLATRNRNQNEAAAKPAPGSPDIGIAGRNQPPSAGNNPDRQLYPPAGGGPGAVVAGGGTSPKQPSLTERVRGNNKANRDPDSYLGEAFDATVKRGRDVGRKHLQGMIARDSVDSDTASKLLSKYDEKIGKQSTLRDYKSEGIAEKFDRENPGKAGRILDEYRAMGRSAGAAPKNATYTDIKARALR